MLRRIFHAELPSRKFPGGFSARMEFFAGRTLLSSIFCGGSGWNFS